MNIKLLFDVEFDLEVTGIATDNRRVQPGDLFVCIKGYTVDGHAFAKQAQEAGAVAIVCEHLIEGIEIPQIIVEDTKVELPRLAHLIFNKPTEKLQLFGLTGTNGKTTTAYILEHLLGGFEGHVGYIGTNGIRYNDVFIEPKNTTPEPLSLQQTFHNMVEAGVKNVAIEVSSHALELHRVDYCRFKVALFTNLTPEHLDFHPTMDEYFEAKYKLNPAINFALLYKICNKLPEIIGNSEISNILDSNEYKPFFDSEIMACFKKINESDVSEYPQEAISSFLHNIYYNHISTSYKIVLEYLISDNFIFEPVIGDARTSLINDKDTYNLIFLDAFTPAKCPCLWTLEFFKLLYEHLSEDGMILTYSNSASIRNAMLNAGFYAGKIYNNEFNKFTGTIAVKNKSLIKFELSEYDLGLINSKAGIFYRDKNLNLSNDEILASHKSELEKSCKMSSSRFIKEFKKKNCL